MQNCDGVCYGEYYLVGTKPILHCIATFKFFKI